MTSPSPFRSLFKTPSSTEHHHHVTPHKQPKEKDDKKTKKHSTPSPAQAQTPTAAAVSKRSILFNLIHPPDPTPVVVQSAMLLPPTALFPHGSGSDLSTTASSTSKPSRNIFSRAKKGVDNGKDAAPATRAVELSSSAAAAAGAAPRRSWAWKSSEKSTECERELQRLAALPPPPMLQQKAEKNKKQSGLGEHKVNGQQQHQQQQQVMLRPSFNTSNQTVAPMGQEHYYPQHHNQDMRMTYPHNQHPCQLQHPPAGSRVGIILAVHDIFGIGKVSEMVLALFLAHDAFLCRRPFWMQCGILIWEGVVVMVVLWTVLRVVGLAEVVVWGADDLVRGLISTVVRLGHLLRALFAFR